MKMWNRIFRSRSSKDNNSKRKKRIVHLEKDLDNGELSSTKVVSDNEDIIYVGAGPEDVELKPCPVCSRTFVPSALEKHVAICEKMAIQKRMPFDSFRQRRKGTELTLYHPSTYGPTTRTKSSKQQANSSSVSSIHEPIQRISDKTQRTSSKFDSCKADTPLMTRSLKRTLGPINEVCPHCSRSFGTRSYDRHVEWCKEKSKITSNTLSAQQHLAKERMQARTKYKAPMCRSKREKNREKYSSLSESMNNLSDGGDLSIVDFNSVADPFETGRKSSIISLSMSSSIASDYPISSNKYDPFISAKRQFDDLFSTDPLITSTTEKGVESVASNLLSTSLTSPPSQAKNLSISKSNFRRTSSLRAPKKTSSISFVPKYKPTIQRGISDEGSISTNFMKSQEFDELPVKSHAIIPPDLVPKIKSTKRLNRENTPVSPVFGLENSKMCKGNSFSPEFHNKINDFQLTKTDSLAAFLEFENDLKYSIPIERARINQSPKSICIDRINAFKENENSTPRRNQDSAVNLLPIERPLIKNKILLDPMGKTSEFNNNNVNIDGESTEFCVLNISNSCDNLEISNSIGTLNGADDSKQQTTERGHKTHSTLKNSSSTESIDSHKNMENIVNLINITDSEKRNPKRQLRFQKDNLLFDNPQYDENVKNNNVSCQYVFTEYIPNNSHKTVPNIDNKRQNHESMFDNFNLEEFISSFSDNEQFPIFKNYKESMRPMTLNIESASENHVKEFLDENIQTKSNNEIEHETYAEKPTEHSIDRFVENNILKKPDVTVEAEERRKLESETKQLTSKREKLLRDVNVDQDRVINAERALLESVQELELMCNVNTDEQNSKSLLNQHNKLQDQRLHNLANKKTEFGQRSLHKSPDLSYQLPELIGIHPENLQKTLPSNRSSPLKEVTEMLQPNKIMTEHILSPTTLHKNDSQNIYNTMNMIMTRKSNFDEPELSFGANSLGKTMKLSKFCHECGAKFIVDQAKFCMECGVRRVTIEQ